MKRDELVAYLDSYLRIKEIEDSSDNTVQRIGIVSGGAGFLAGQAAEAGVDVYLTGEVSHSVYHEAQELGLNVVYGGHYATETAGLKSLAQHLVDRFGLETVFLDLPTGA